jgi:hypothetical protein
MLQIRLNVFETNSSSLHSFYIKEDFKLERFKEPKVIDVYWYEFNCEPAKYTCCLWFLDYVWTAIRDSPKRKKYQKRIDKILEPYNVTVNWNPKVAEDIDFELGVNHWEFFIPILDELLKKPELFLSALFCPESRFYIGRDENENVFNDEQEGFVHFMKESP